MRTKQEQEEVYKAFNLSKEVVEKYVQFGEVFNLLHAGASYLRVHQKGFGAVGVSNKYGPRSYARYPIFWGLKEIGKLPNPDPSDTEPWDREAEEKQVITVDPAYESGRGDLRRQAQEWAHLNVDPNAELFVFVGRWSVQKGVDLIADVFPAVLDKHQSVQLICIGQYIVLSKLRPRPALTCSFHFRPCNRLAREVRCAEARSDHEEVSWKSVLKA